MTKKRRKNNPGSATTFGDFVSPEQRSELEARFGDLGRGSGPEPVRSRRKEESLRNKRKAFQ